MQLWIVLVVPAAGLLVVAVVWNALASSEFEPDPEFEDNSASDPPAYRYYSLDAKFFRVQPGENETPEFLQFSKWVPFKGDPLEPVALGKRITPDDLPGREGELAQLLEARDTVKRQLEILRTGHNTPPPSLKPLREELTNVLSGLEQRLSALQGQ